MHVCSCVLNLIFSVIIKYSRGIEISAAFFCHFLNFELIAVSVFKSSLSPAAHSLLCRKSLVFVNKSKLQKHDKTKKRGYIIYLH
jgi:hypothetical protein